MRVPLLALTLLAAISSGCDYQVTLPAPAVPTPTPTAAPADVVEFRVEGDLTLATVRITNTLDGTTQVSSVLPYTSTLSLAGYDTVFLSLDARSPFLNACCYVRVAILINGLLFREASSSALNPAATVSGTWRKPR